MADTLRTTPRTLKKRVRDDGIPHIVFGRSMLFDLADVELFLKGRSYAKQNVIKMPLPKIPRKSKVTIKSKFAEAVR